MMSEPVSTETLRSEKILPCHWERLAIVYVRQSSLQQVLNHQESTRLQYGLVERAQAFGWNQERILVIDDDLGKSGATAEGRAGFQRLVAEVGLNHVGLILGIEMSRLSRSSKDWHQLLEICSLFGTLIADLDGIYDPNQFNDRLLLGLRGTMSEAELYLLKQRLDQGKLNKARRGELHFRLPTGYIRRPSGEVTFDPDEQVQQVIRLIFRKFEELGTVNAVLQYLVKQNIQLGIRAITKMNQGELEWCRPYHGILRDILKNPIYAGAYAYGRRQVDPLKRQLGKPLTGRVAKGDQDWHVLLQDRFPAYISWEQYQRNLARLKANRACAEALGVPRQGEALLGGLLVCGKCGSRMRTRYSRSNLHEYLCSRQKDNYGAQPCQCISGAVLDQSVTQQVLMALEPAALELSLASAQQIEQDRTELDKLWRQRLERASYQADYAGRHYRQVEPENRLVARQLARDWEEKLQIYQQLKEDYERFAQQHPRILTEQERDSIRQLAQNIPALWHAPTTTNAQRKEIIRQLIERIRITVQGNSEILETIIEWAGGACTEAQVIRPIAKLTQLSNYDELCQRVTQLVESGLSPREISQLLNQEGFHTPKGQTTFNENGVKAVMRRLGLTRPRTGFKPSSELRSSEWWLLDLAQHLGMSDVTLYDWVKRGWVKARQQDTPLHHWIIWADEAEIERLQQKRQGSRVDEAHQRWLEKAKSDLLPCTDQPTSYVAH
jgi:DNA invertase Pin-like site-specific DNA recombinase